MIDCVAVVCRPSRKRRSGLGRWDVWEARCVGLGGEMCDFLKCEWTGMVTKASLHFGHLRDIYNLRGSGIGKKLRLGMETALSDIEVMFETVKCRLSSTTPGNTRICAD